MAHRTRRETASNRDNFDVIFEYGVKRGDTLLREHLPSPTGNATYTSSKLSDVVE